MPLVESRGFSFDLDAFAQKLSPQTKMVVLNSPANPTGGVIPKEDLQRIADLLRDRDVLILSDEIYSRIFYERGAGVDHAVRRHAREDGHSRRLLEDLLDDRLASGLRRDAAVAGRCGQPADGELELVHGQLHAARRHGGAGGAAGLRGRDGGGVPPPARRHRRGAERDSRASAAPCPRARSTRSRTSPAPACRARSWPTCCCTRPASRA